MSDIFDASKLKRTAADALTLDVDDWFVDGSDAYANHRQMHISFLHVPSGTEVFFKAFITAFNEAYNSDWAPESVYGRPDPIYLFKSTTRKITLAFNVPAASESEAFENLGRVQKLTQFLYPNYSTVEGDIFAQTISQSPLVRLKVMNLLEDQSTPADDRTYEGLVVNKLGTDSGAQFGLLGVIDNIAVNHNMSEQGGFNEGSGVILPKLLDLNLSFSPIHEHPLGWNEENEFSNTLFPYGINLKDSLPADPSAVDTEQNVSSATSDETANSEAIEEDALNPDTTSAVEEVPGGTAAEAENQAEEEAILGI